MHFLSDVINENFTVSFITYIEFLGYKNVAKASEDFIALADVIEINKTIIDTCIALRKNHKIKTPDAIIAATALVYDLTLLTRNFKDYKDIQNLNFIDLHNL